MFDLINLCKRIQKSVSYRRSCLHLSKYGKDRHVKRYAEFTIGCWFKELVFPDLKIKLQASFKWSVHTIYRTFEQTNMWRFPSTDSTFSWSWGRPQSFIHFLHFSRRLLGFGKGINFTSPTKRSGYRLSELQSPHWQRFTILNE